MKITALTLGSRGDIEPVLGLAVEMQKAGHRVTIVASKPYLRWIESYGVTAYLGRLDAQEFMARMRRKKSDDTTISALGSEPGFFEMICDYEAASQDADLILQTGVAWGGIEIASMKGIPVAFAHAFPATPTREFPAFSLPWRGSLGGRYNLWSQQMVERIAWLIFGKPLNKFRSARGLSALHSYSEMIGPTIKRAAPTLYSYSPNMVPNPKDWPSNHRADGYWYLQRPSGWQAPECLEKFLMDGPKPVFVGFGSMTQADPEKQTYEIIRALKHIGQRGVLYSGGGKSILQKEATDDVYFVNDIPFDYLFQRVAVVVHHGGSGTTATAARVGTPSVILPVAYDQFAWASIVEGLGVGINGGRLNKLDGRKLGNLINFAIGDQYMRRRAGQLSERINAERGAAATIGILEEYVDRFSRGG